MDLCFGHWQLQCCCATLKAPQLVARENWRFGEPRNEGGHWAHRMYNQGALFSRKKRGQSDRGENSPVQIHPPKYVKIYMWKSLCAWWCYLKTLLVRVLYFSFHDLVWIVHFDGCSETVASNICSLSVTNRNISYCKPSGPRQKDNCTLTVVSRCTAAPPSLHLQCHHFLPNKLHMKNQLSLSI